MRLWQDDDDPLEPLDPAAVFALAVIGGVLCAVLLQIVRSL